MPVQRVGEASHPGPLGGGWASEGMFDDFPAVGQQADDVEDDPWPEPPKRWVDDGLPFCQADEFTGPRSGMCFRRGELGQGYYNDQPEVRARHVAEIARRWRFEQGDCALTAYLTPRPPPAGASLVPAAPPQGEASQYAPDATWWAHSQRQAGR